ncbi:hypothetical protein ACSQ6I_07465, partial [Anabaena sp. WFMT]|uniref:hypothetical protein n=1 Tax=Anabaena sp. WFMT TaxID=3449730 RepID=UPI003F1FAAD9
ETIHTYGSLISPLMRMQSIKYLPVYSLNIRISRNDYIYIKVLVTDWECEPKIKDEIKLLWVQDYKLLK